MFNTAIVILNWNGINYLKDFLPDIIKYSKDTVDIIVADNGSTDDSVNFLRSEYKETVKILKLENNLGFAGGYNKAIEELKYKYLILLNSDVEVTENWITPVINLMESDDSIAACQPKIKSFVDKSLFEYAGGAGGYIDKFGYPFCRGRIFTHVEKDSGQYDEIKEIFWATGACMFIRTNKFKEVGGFDADYFAHMEEIDLCWRLKRCGYKIMYEPKSTVYHVGGGTLPKTSPMKTYLNFRNNLATLYKNLPSTNLFVIILIRLILDGVAGIKFLLAGNFLDCWAVFRAHNSFFHTLGETRRKRRAFLQKFGVTEIYGGNIVLDYYIKRKKKFSELDF